MIHQRTLKMYTNGLTCELQRLSNVWDLGGEGNERFSSIMRIPTPCTAFVLHLAASALRER